VSYTVTVTNNGPSSAASVVVSDPTPPNTAFVSNSGGCTTPYPCNLGTLTLGQVVTVTSTYAVSPSFSGSLVNTATVSSGTTDPNATNDSANATTIVGPQADLAITKSGPAGAIAGNNIVYTVTVTNNGPSSSSSVVVSDPTPANMTFVSNSGACAT